MYVRKKAHFVILLTIRNQTTSVMRYSFECEVIKLLECYPILHKNLVH